MATTSIAHERAERLLTEAIAGSMTISAAYKDARAAVDTAPFVFILPDCPKQQRARRLQQLETRAVTRLVRRCRTARHLREQVALPY